MQNIFESKSIKEIIIIQKNIWMKRYFIIAIAYRFVF